MSRDNKSKISKKELNKRSKKEDEKTRNKKRNEESDSDNDMSDSEDEEINVHEYRKFLSKIFPSKHLNKKIKDGEKLKKKIEEDWETESDEDYEEEKYSKKKVCKNKKKCLKCFYFCRQLMFIYCVLLNIFWY